VTTARHNRDNIPFYGRQCDKLWRKCLQLCNSTLPLYIWNVKSQKNRNGRPQMCGSERSRKIIFSMFVLHEVGADRRCNCTTGATTVSLPFWVISQACETIGGGGFENRRFVSKRITFFGNERCLSNFRELVCAHLPSPGCFPLRLWPHENSEKFWLHENSGHIKF
jgi:hypothetical protein